MGFSTPALAREAASIYDVLTNPLYTSKGVKLSALQEHCNLTQGEASSFPERCPSEVIEVVNSNMKSHRRYRIRAGVGKDAFIEALGGTTTAVANGKCQQRHYTPIDLDGRSWDALKAAIEAATELPPGRWQGLACSILTYLDRPLETPVAISTLEED